MLETVFAEKLGTRGVRWMDGWIDEKFRCCMGGNFSQATVTAVTCVVDFEIWRVVRDGDGAPYQF